MSTAPRFHLVSLGCSKNTVDSDSMAALLEQAGYRAVRQANRAQVLIVNTCGFIGPAREESLRVLRELASGKKPGQLLIAAGCMTQRFGAEVAREVPGIDGILGTRRWMDVVDLLQRPRDGSGPTERYHLPTDSPTVGRDERGVLRASIQGASAYLKIADGCRRPCAFCAIPLIKGTAVSRPIERLLEEARILQARGVREIILIAQDTTDYGRDLGWNDGLSRLLEAMLPEVPGVEWVRLMYAFPGAVTDRLIETLASHSRIVPYLDLPLQHADPRVLRRMRRPSNLDRMRSTLERMRAAIPDLAIRSTFIVGYPGETEEEFETLIDFLNEMRFDRVGCFTYSHEPGTESGRLEDTVPGVVKEERRARLMELQKSIGLEKNQAWVGRTMAVLVEGEDRKKNIAVGRSFRDAPEVDGLVLIEGQAPIGCIVPVRITGALPYDLVGQLTRARGEAPAPPPAAAPIT
ncbi:MAG: 30S ribosomal protein S12 methylthiotransferase RimO [Anaerolineales bacterium]